MKIIVYVLALIAGMSLSLEAAIGGALGENIGELESTYFIFIIGAMATFLIALFFGKGDVKQITKVPRWQLIGGVLGVIYLAFLIISVNLVGVGTAVTAVIIGQLVMSMIVDHFGWLGTPKARFNVNRLIAGGLLIASLFLIL
ncbi:transporter family-2 protein [Sinobaca qinghaiensis]|uniref:Transporter family-2 protein n=1 Tax=Sinobaca qinghaiensis TaxID=342944 RepID=A0A419V4U2_9BACL|nr:DMT family transporter [Sinobaca qinghaiensis]RKD73548.1 transporter family-2 protein [Sinobaca qinghaiensis]